MQHLPTGKTEMTTELRKVVPSTSDTWWRPMLAAGLGIESMIDRVICGVEKGT
ncbi:MAG: hypothetical protein AAF922_09755 [Pseudomonadota bacterium]